MTQPHVQESDWFNEFQAKQASMVSCDGCGAEWEDLDAATHSEGYSEKGCPNRCRMLTTPVYWPDEHTDKWKRIADGA